MGGQKWTDTDFGERLRDLRDGEDWTQTQLADKLSTHGIHMTAAQIARIEKGERSVRAVEAAALADLYKISVDALLGRKGRPKSDFMHALRGLVDAKEQARWAVESHQRALSEAATGLADADTGGRYAELVADCESACKALDAARQILASIGDSTNPQAAAAVKEGTIVMMRQWLAEQESDK
jgi:transcriptional regulator with XRE-family HTH domain